MRENKNWEGFTDVSHPNWTLRTPRVSKGGYFADHEKKRDSIVWWLLIAAVILGFVLML